MYISNNFQYNVAYSNSKQVNNMIRFFCGLLSFYFYYWGCVDAAATPINKPNGGRWENVFSNGSTLIPLVHFGTKSYYLGENFQATYLEAYQFCKEIDMELVRVENKEEKDQLYKFVQEAKGDRLWTAGSKVLNKKNWIWMTTGEVIEYTNWAENQPDNPNSELCLEVVHYKNMGLYYNDRECHTKLPFICERDRRRPHTANCGSGCNWSNVFQNPSVSPNINLLNFEGKSYYFGTYFKATYLQAIQFCEIIDMKLVSITSEAENNRIHKHLRDTGVGENLWSSGTKSIDGKNWVWLSTGQKVEYTHWLSGQPDSVNEQCIELVQRRQEGLFWNDLTCTSTLFFICERSETYEPHLTPGPVIKPRPSGSVPSKDGDQCPQKEEPVVNVHINNECCSGKNTVVKCSSNGGGYDVASTNGNGYPSSYKPKIIPQNQEADLYK